MRRNNFVSQPKEARVALNVESFSSTYEVNCLHLKSVQGEFFNPNGFLACFFITLHAEQLNHLKASSCFQGVSSSRFQQNELYCENFSFLFSHFSLFHHSTDIPRLEAPHTFLSSTASYDHPYYQLVSTFSGSCMTKVFCVQLWVFSSPNPKVC